MALSQSITILGGLSSGTTASSTGDSHVIWETCQTQTHTRFHIPGGPPLCIFAYNKLVHLQNFMIFGTNKLHKATNEMVLTL